MKLLNNYLRLAFVLVAFVFLLVLLSTPKTHCQACSLEYRGDNLNGYEAYQVYEDACISYNNPWQTGDATNFTLEQSTGKEEFYVNIDDINISANRSLSWDPDDELTREEINR